MANQATSGPTLEEIVKQLQGRKLEGHWFYCVGLQTTEVVTVNADNFWIDPEGRLIFDLCLDVKQPETIVVIEKGAWLTVRRLGQTPDVEPLVISAHVDESNDDEAINDW